MREPPEDMRSLRNKQAISTLPSAWKRTAQPHLKWLAVAADGVGFGAGAGVAFLGSVGNVGSTSYAV